MPIDYSKWDKIELSDDSDIEVHPNVDKSSFIRWKQQSIHEQRAKRNQDIKNLEFQLEMNSRLNKRVDKLLKDLPDQELVDLDIVRKTLNANFDKTEKGEGDNVDPDMPPYNEMVEDLIEQLQNDAKKEGKDPGDGSVIRSMIQQHRAKIDNVSEQARQKLEELYQEKRNLISSEDIHTGFEKSFVNKASEKEDKEGRFLPRKADAPNDIVLPSPPQTFIEYQDDIMKLAPETEEFGKIPETDLKASETFLLNHLPIISEQQKDALMMSAFEYQMAGEEAMARRVIHQSELLAYIREIYEMKKIPHLQVKELSEVIKMFFEKVMFNKSNEMGKKSFLESVNAKIEHVKQRVKVIEQEEEQEGVETIQLKSLDDSVKLEVNLPDFESTQHEEQLKQAAFNKLPVQMQDAVRSQSLDRINEVFADMPIEEAEKVLDLLNEGNIIAVNALLEDENEFRELQEQYHNEQGIEDLSIDENSKVQSEGQSSPTSTDGFVSTSEVVD
ncbi:LAFE_0H07228g1_1 [Lachancea fermentati]|uniref:Hsp90 chaperone protein kinase-targeting subunit n=1 Tax=Lachancea fermentati TaxID=4955 RepID=A0A1G4MJV4_LACFM|nr:LAFE_0H07228g1_1 [Lachancea fermentati]